MLRGSKMFSVSLRQHYELNKYNEISILWAVFFSLEKWFSANLLVVK